MGDWRAAAPPTARGAAAGASRHAVARGWLWTVPATRRCADRTRRRGQAVVPDRRRDRDGDAQAGCVGRHEQGPTTQAARGPDQARDLRPRENLRQSLRHFGHGNVEPRVRSLRHPFVDEAESAGRLIDAGVGLPALGDEVQQIRLQFVGRQGIRWAPVVPCQPRRRPICGSRFGTLAMGMSRRAFGRCGTRS